MSLLLLRDSVEHILLVNRSTVLKDVDVAYLAEAMRLYVEAIGQAYGWAPPGISVVNADAEIPSSL